YYGTLRSFIEENIHKGKLVLLNIDTQGGLAIKKIFPHAKLIGLLPPSRKEQERRLRQRGGLTKAEVQTRLAETKKERECLFRFYDIRFINRDLESTIKKIKNFILRHKRKLPPS
ncbi:MAG: guanylate kinase, partial [Candidatus Omnitrophica bacterium]|nr:guanylate kinase [Candidatus Omnitrophota bacterium]